MQQVRRNQAGFTLIELLIVMTISIMLMLTASSLFLTLLVGNTKTNSAQLVKSEGSNAMSQIEFLLRNAVQIPTCAASANQLTFISLDGGTTTLQAVLASDGKYKIASNSAYLTSGSVDLINGATGLTFNCVQSADGLSKYVNTSFTLRKGNPNVDAARDIVEETFSAGINMRSN